MKVSDYIIDYIYKTGTDTIFSFSGGMITHLEDSVFLSNKIKLVSVKHEQGGAFAAEGYTRSSTRVGVAMGTSGPGATNMVTGIASSYYDSIPTIYITGQVNRSEITTLPCIRQTGFQETDIISIVSKITKFAYQIQTPEEIRYVLEKGFYLATSGRKGPVVLDIPMDIQRAEIDPDILPSYFESDEYVLVDRQICDIKEVIELLEQSVRPIVLIGGGIKSSFTQKNLVNFVTKTGLPVVASLMGLDSIDHTLSNYVGMIGVYGNRQANIAIMNADIVLVLGSRLDIRQTGAKRDGFCPNAKIIHIDIDAHELGYTIKNTYLKIHTNIQTFFGAFERYVLDNPLKIKIEDWLEKLTKLKKLLPLYLSHKENGDYNMNYFFELLCEKAGSQTIFVNDVGQNQMWSSQAMRIRGNQQLINCGGMGAMGFSLPSAIGCYYANPDFKIISINGDGGFQLNIQELETISYNKIPLLIVVVNNHSLGMIREFQDTYFDGRNIGSVDGYSCPDLSKIAKAYSLKYYRISKSNVEKILEKAILEKHPTILEVMCSSKSKLEPKILFGSSLDNQSPELNQKLTQEIKNILNQ